MLDKRVLDLEFKTKQECVQWAKTNGWQATDALQIADEWEASRHEKTPVQTTLFSRRSFSDHDGSSGTTD